MEKTESVEGVNNVVWKIAGEAGYGIMATGYMFSQLCTRGGLWVFDINEYPSLIRGGHNTYLVRVADREVYAPLRGVTLLAALNRRAVEAHLEEIVPGGGIIYDPEETKIREIAREDVKVYQVPLLGITRELGVDRIMRNNAALGATLALFDYDFGLLEDAIKRIFKRKGEKVIQDNLLVARRGYDHIKENYDDFGFKLRKIGSRGRMVLTCNDAAALGALRAGLKFYAGYPMTPSSSILHYMAAQERRMKLVVKHTEDEISAINMIVGASIAGVRAMTATSGGGFCLMSEGYGMAGMVEAPIVVVVAMRPGPSTGMPTWTSQGDLKFLLSASQDEFPRIVLAPGDTTQTFYLTAEAFNLAERYQTPVIVALDKYLSESHKTTEKFDQGRVKIERGWLVDEKEIEELGEEYQCDNFFKRYKFTEDGISPRSIPGQKKGMYCATSDEHEETGYVVEGIENRNRIMEKRMKKLEKAARELPPPRLEGDSDAKITFVGWGSTRGPILEAMKMLEQNSITASYLQIIYLNPLHSREIGEILRGVKRPVLVENNYSGQLGELIRAKTGFEIKEKILKYDGRPFFPEEIYERIT